MADPQTRKLARQIVDIDRRLKGVERTPQLAHSSIDDGFLPVYDKDGNLTAKFGRQDDGTWGAPPLSGPVPSMPVGVTALGGPGMLSVSWTGEYESKAAPLDFDTLEILVDGVLAGAIPNRDGGTVSISAEEGTRYISARIRTLVPRHSSTISPFGVEVGPPADQLFAEARERIEDAEQSLADSQVRLDEAEAELVAVREDLDGIEAGGNPSLVKDRAPTVGDGEGLTAGAAWLQYDEPGGTLVAMFRWDGEAWESLPMDREMIPQLDIGSGTFGDLEGDRLVVNGDLSARVASVMDLTAKKLIVTEEAILNHATLIGQTVVDDINVQGKLIGTDGVFTGTVDFANVNVTGTQIVNKIAANSIEASKIKGGDFTGKTFFGGAFYGGRFATSNEPFTDGGVQIDAQYGLRGWAAGSDWRDTTFQMSPVDGSLQLAANSYFTDPTSGDGLIISPSTSRGNAALFFGRNKSVNADQAAIWRISYSTARDQLMLRGGNGAGITALGSNHLLNGRTEIGGNLVVYNDVHAYGRIDVDGAFAIKGNGGIDGHLYYYGTGTTSSGANLYRTPGGGRVSEVTSSRRFKRNIAEWNPDADRVLALRPRQWQHDDPRSDIDEQWHVGFIAEEVDELGLKPLVTYAGDGRGGWEPWALNYDRFCAAQQVVLVDHESRIKELEARIAELEGAGR